MAHVKFQAESYECYPPLLKMTHIYLQTKTMNPYFLNFLGTCTILPEFIYFLTPGIVGFL